MGTQTNEALAKSYTPAAFEDTVRARWDAAEAFHADPTAPGKPFCVLIPPPNVTAALHLGHAFNNTLQDILVRYHRMRGFNTLWMPGTDHAGIATQTVVEKRLLQEEGKRRTEYDRDEFVAKVQAWKDEYEATITEQLKAMGCSCDFARQRFTMDEVCAKAVREAFFRLFKARLIYRGKRLVNWDPATQTALADDEVEMEEVRGKFWYLRYPLVREDGEDGPEYVVVATTRPETMLGDTAVAVNPRDPERSTLIGRKVRLPIVDRVVPIVGDDYVVMPDPDSSDAKARYASGFLKVTPGHDPNDWEIGRRHEETITEVTGFVVLNVMAPDASISDAHGWSEVENPSEEARTFLGLSREAARERVVDFFRANDLLEAERDYVHSVGHSYRSHVPIEPYLSDQWYVKVTDDRLVGEAQRALANEQFDGAKPRRSDVGVSPSSSGTGVSPSSSGTGVSPSSSGTGVSPSSSGTGVSPVTPGEGSMPSPGVRAATGVPPTLSSRRRNLPHWELGGSVYYVTFRLRQGELAPPERAIVARSLQHWHGDRVHLHLAVVMPDHVHLLVQPLPRDQGTWWSLSEILHSIKSFTAHEIQRKRGTSGPLWQDESFDRIVRDEEELLEKWKYIIENPVRAGLVEEAEAYEFLVSPTTAEEAVEASAAVTGETPVPLSKEASSGEAPVPREEDRSKEGEGELRFHPARYAKMYQSWHENLRDWCISRQLWWGHRIPVWVHRIATSTEPDDQTLDRLEREGRISRQHFGPQERLHRPTTQERNDYICIRDERDQEAVRIVEGFGYRQDPDVLDTWFSSGLWPLSTMGWPEPSDFPDEFPAGEALLNTFNPSSTLCTAREIITLWVSRMVMFNRFFRDGTVPFRDVYIHAMIQDGHGQKMSKSLGNGVDPRDIIHSHGADALRYTLTELATQTQDVRLPVDVTCPHCETSFEPKEVTTPAGYRVAAPIQTCPHCGGKAVSGFGYASGEAKPTAKMPLARNSSSRFDVGRSFCNKLWNAVRFALVTLGEEPDGRDPGKATTPVGELTLVDRWILTRLSETVRAVEKAIGSYQFNAYAEAIYDFARRDFCDWYLEAIKPTVREDAGQQQTLRTVLNAILRLLHPMCPFITEELWPFVRKAGPAGVAGVDLAEADLLALAPWPAVDPAIEDDEAARTFERAQHLVNAIRNVRGEHNIPPKQKITLRATEAVRELIEATGPAVPTLAGLEAVEPRGERGPADVPVTFENEEQLLGGLMEEIDRDAEIERLARDLEALAERRRALERRLNNPGYVEKAPARIVDETREQLRSVLEEEELKTRQLHALRGEQPA